VAAVVEMVAEGMTIQEIIDNHPDLQPEDIGRLFATRLRP
jgi:uncharacterized protein (DUF433 family)